MEGRAKKSGLKPMEIQPFDAATISAPASPHYHPRVKSFPHSANTRPNNAASSGDDVDRLRGIFPLPPSLVVCLVRHVDKNLQPIATPTCVEQCVCELQAYFSPFIPASQVCSAGECYPNSRIALQFGKTVDASRADDAVTLHLFIACVDKGRYKPRVLAQVAREWRERLAKIGSVENCLVMLYHEDLVAAAKASHAVQDGRSVAAEVDRRKVDAAVVTLELCYQELRALHFTVHQMCAYVPHEAPLRVVERLKSAVDERAAWLKKVYDQYRADRRHSVVLRGKGSKAASGMDSFASTSRAAAAQASRTTHTAHSLMGASVHAAFSATENVDPQASVSQLSMPLHTDGTDNSVALVHVLVNSSISSGTVHAYEHALNLSMNNDSRVTPVRVSNVPTSPPTMNFATSVTNIPPSGLRVWSVQQLWRFGYDLVLHYLQFGYVRKAEAVYREMFLEYFNNSDDYDFVYHKETLLRLGQTTNMLDPHWSITDMGKSGYPNALEDTAEPVEGLLFVCIGEMTCSQLLDNVDAIQTRYETFMEVVTEKFAEVHPESIPLAYQHFFLLQCTLSSIRIFWASCKLWALPVCVKSKGSLPTDTVDEISLPTSPSIASSLVDEEGNSKRDTEPFSLLGAPSQALLSNYLTTESFVALRPLCLPKQMAGVRGQASCYSHRMNEAGGLEDELSEILSLAELIGWVPVGVQVVDINSSGWEAKDEHKGITYTDHISDVRAKCAMLAHAVLRAREALERFGNTLGCPCMTSEAQVSSHQGTSFQAEQHQLHRSVFADIAELHSQESFALLWRILTVVGAMGFDVALQQRRAFCLYTNYALSYLDDDPEVAARCTASRLLPRLRETGWWPVERFVRHMYVECVYRWMEKEGVPIQAPAASSRKWKSLLSHMFPTERSYFAYKECLLFTMQTADGNGVRVGQAQTPITAGGVEQAVALGTLSLDGKQFPRRSSQEWWTVMRRVDILVGNNHFKKAVGECTMAPLLRYPSVVIERASTPLSDSAVRRLAPTDLQRPLASETQPDLLHSKIFEPIAITFTAGMPINPLVQLHNDQENGSVVVRLVLESRNDWEDDEESTEFTHVVCLNKAQTLSYDQHTGQLLAVFLYQPCHCGTYRLRCVRLEGDATYLVFWPQHSIPEGGPAFNDAALAEPFSMWSGEDSDGDEANYGRDHRYRKPRRIPWFVNYACPPEACTNLLFAVSEPSSGVRLSVDNPEEEHCFSDAPTYFTLRVDVDEPTELPEVGGKAFPGTIDTECTFEVTAEVSDQGGAPTPAGVPLSFSMASVKSRMLGVSSTACIADPRHTGDQRLLASIVVKPAKRPGNTSYHSGARGRSSLSLGLLTSMSALSAQASKRLLLSPARHSLSTRNSVTGLINTVCAFNSTVMAEYSTATNSARVPGGSRGMETGQSGGTYLSVVMTPSGVPLTLSQMPPLSRQRIQSRSPSFFLVDGSLPSVSGHVSPRNGGGLTLCSPDDISTIARPVDSTFSERSPQVPSQSSNSYHELPAVISPSTADALTGSLTLQCGHSPFLTDKMITAFTNTALTGGTFLGQPQLRVTISQHASAALGGESVAASFASSGVGVRSNRIPVTSVAHTVIPVDEARFLSHLPSPTVSSAPPLATSEGWVDEVPVQPRLPCPLSMDGRISTLPRRECVFQIALKNANRGETTQQHEISSTIEGETELTFFETSRSLFVRLPLLPQFMSGSSERSSISFSYFRGGQMNTCNLSHVFPFDQAIRAQYTFKHFYSRVFCLVKLVNVLQRTSLWLRGAVLDLLDATPAFEVVRVSEVYEHMLETEWRPKDAFQLLYELAPCAHGWSQGSAEAAVRHKVQLRVFYSKWETRKSAMELATCASEYERPELVLRPLTSAATNRGGHGVSSATYTNTAGEDTIAYNDNTSRSSGCVPEAAGNSSTLMASASWDGSLGDAQNLFTERLCKKRSLALAKRRLSSSAPARPKLRFKSGEVDWIASQCNTFFAAPASFQSKHLCMFSAIIFPVSPWSSRRGKGVTSPKEAPVMRYHSHSSPNNPFDLPKVLVSAHNSLSTRANGTTIRSGAPTSMCDAVVELPNYYQFVCGEPVTFCVRLEPQVQNWPEDARMEEEFIIHFQCDPTQWMIIGRQRERRTLSVTSEVMLCFTAVPYISAGGANSGEERLGALCTGAKEDNANPAVCSDPGCGILQTPTVAMYWASSGEQKALKPQPGAPVSLDIVPFRTWVVVRK